MSLELNNICKKYNKKKQVLNNLCLEIQNNTVCSIVGTNGVGKSTLIKSILGLIKIDSGYIKYNDQEITNLIKQGKVGYLPEYLDFSKSILLYDYLRDMSIIKGMNKHTAEERINSLLEMFDLKKNAYESIYKFSKGMKKKVGFIQAVLNSPELLILDEPTDGLDPKSRRTMLKFIKDLTTQNCTVIITSHILADLELISDTVSIIHNGKIIEEFSRESFQLKNINFKISFKNNETENIESDFIDNNFTINCTNSKILKEITVTTKYSSIEDLFLNSLQEHRRK